MMNIRLFYNEYVHYRLLALHLHMLGNFSTNKLRLKLRPPVTLERGKLDTGCSCDEKSKVLPFAPIPS